MPLRNLQLLVENAGAQTARASDLPGSRRAAAAGPGNHFLVSAPRPPSTPPLPSVPGGRRVRLTPGGTSIPAPRARMRGPFRGLKHNALELQLPRRPARFPRVGTTAPPEAAGKRPRDRSGRARAAVPLETQVRRPPETLSDFARHLSSLSDGTCAHLVPGAHGPSPRLRAQVPLPPSPPAPQPRPPPTFGFPARPEPLRRLGNHL